MVSIITSQFGLIFVCHTVQVNVADYDDLLLLQELLRTDRHADRNTLHPCKGRQSNYPPNPPIKHLRDHSTFGKVKGSTVALFLTCSVRDQGSCIVYAL